jgi:hypothetical protein
MYFHFVFMNIYLLPFRAKKVLPQNTSRQQRVVYCLANAICPNVLKSAQASQKRERVSLEICETLKSFYLRDDISIIMPGHADTIAVREGGLKITMQKRFLTFSLREAYIEFVKENGKIVSRSYFCEHRPKNVLLYSDIPHNVCACRMHEDFIA